MFPIFYTVRLFFWCRGRRLGITFNTDYTYYYQAFYDNWKETIVSLASDLDSVGINKAILTSHVLIDKDISHVVYTLKDNSGTIELYVNATSKNYTYTDELANVYEIPAYSCVKVN